MARLSGSKLGKYQIGERLGRGNMAEVYKAFHPYLERHVAVKVLHHFLSEGENFLVRFQREAKAIAALEHPNIIRIYDIDIEDKLYYMVMEFIEGDTLKNYLAQSEKPLPIPEVAYIFREIASALNYAHQQGMLHRDIKPANILLGKDGRVVLADFGIARILSDTQFTATGALVGTPAYMSPEQGRGTSVSAGSDIFALGILLYEMLTGKIPFDADTPMDIIRQHVHVSLPSPRAIRHDMPKALEEVIVRATQKDPRHRFQTVTEMVDALDAALDTFPAEDAIPIFPTKMDSFSKVIPEIKDIQSERKTSALSKEDKGEDKTTVIAEQAGNAVFLKKKSQIEKTAVSKPVPKQPKFKRVFIILGIVGIALIAGLLAWGLPKLSIVERACVSVEECHALAEERMEQADREGALFAIEDAINLVPEDEHIPYAHLWCFRGEILVSLERRDEALGSFEDCIHWSEGDPGMEGLRTFAQEQIDMLNEQ